MNWRQRTPAIARRRKAGKSAMKRSRSKCFLHDSSWRSVEKLAERITAWPKALKIACSFTFMMALTCEIERWVASLRTKDHGYNSITSLRLLSNSKLWRRHSAAAFNVTFLLRQQQKKTDFLLLISPWELLQLHNVFARLRLRFQLPSTSLQLLLYISFLTAGSNLRFENRFNCKSERSEADTRR